MGHTGRRRMARMTKMVIWPWKWGGMWPGRVSASEFEYSLAFEKEKAELTHGCAFQNYQKSLHNTAISSHHVTWRTCPPSDRANAGRSIACRPVPIVGANTALPSDKQGHWALRVPVGRCTLAHSGKPAATLFSSQYLLGGEYYPCFFNDTSLQRVPSQASQRLMDCPTSSRTLNC